MEETNVKIKPKQPKIVTRVSNIENLQKSADDLNTTSRRIRRLFEKNTYQKRTQLSVLRRYKRRLDSIERAEEERKRKASKRKIQLPTIKKFAGSFFAPDASKDPLKAIGALAAFNSVDKLMQGDFLGALSPGMVAAAALLGPGLLGMAGDTFFKKGPKVTRDYGNNLGWERAKQGRYGDKGSHAGAQKDIRERYARRYGENAANKKFASTGGGRTAKAFGRLGKSIIPGVGAVLGAVDAKMRADEGDITGSRIAGASATLDTLAAASAATGIGIVATPFLGLASMTLDLVNFARDITGMSEAESKKKKSIQTKLEEQTKEQKKSTQRREEGGVGLSFAKTLVGYERVVNKFEEFAENFKSPKTEQDQMLGEGQARDQVTTGGGPSQATGQNVPESPDGLPSLPPTGLLSGQNYGAPRSYGGHTGQDFDISGNEKFYSRLGGDVIFARNVGGEYGNVVEIYNKDLNRTEVIAEANHIMSNIKEGMTIAPGTPVVYGERTVPTAGGSVGVVHYEIVKGFGGISNRNNKTESPLEFLRSKEYNDYIKTKVNKKSSQSTPKSSSNPASSSVQPVPGTKYTLRGTTIFKGNDGKYYSIIDGKSVEVDKRNWEYVKKEGDLVSFSPRQRDINSYTSYESPSEVIAFVQPQPSQHSQVVPQLSGPLAFNIGGGSGRIDIMNRNLIYQTVS